MDMLPHDRCPECLGLLAVTPYEYHADDHVVQYKYVCPNPDCRHEWTAQWGLGVLDDGLDGAA